MRSSASSASSGVGGRSNRVGTNCWAVEVDTLQNKRKTRASALLVFIARSAAAGAADFDDPASEKLRLVEQRLVDRAFQGLRTFREHQERDIERLRGPLEHVQAHALERLRHVL